MQKTWINLKKISVNAVELFTRHDLMTFAAALSFYTALSLAPLLIITLSVVSLVDANYQNLFLNEVTDLLGSQAGEAITAVVKSVNMKPELGTLAGLLGIIALIFSASGVFAQLQSSLNIIFEAQEKETSGILNWLRNRLLSIGMVASIGFLAIVSLVVSTVISFLFERGKSYWSVANGLFSVLVFSCLFAILFKYLPDVKMKWKNAFQGGIVTAVLFTIGKSLIALYLGKSAVGSAYGAAGSLIVLLVWVYYSSIILFTGAELTNQFKVLKKQNS